MIRRHGWLLAVGVLLTQHAFVTTQTFPPLFRAAAAADAPLAAPGVKRSRMVTVAAKSIDAAPSTVGNARSVQLNLFEDATFVADLVRTPSPPGGGPAVTWVGALRDQPGSQVFFTDRGGVVAANIRTTDGRSFQIRYTGSGENHVVQEVDPKALPKDGPPRRVPPGDAPPAGAALPVGDAPACADDNTLDILVAYTPAVRKKFGNTAGVNTLIDLALAETNQGYAASHITQRIRIVHRTELDYDETPGYDQALTDVTGKTDGKLDSVHALRDRHKADMVSLWIDHGQYCGLAWLMENPGPSFADNAFSVVNANCATGLYSFAHEMGHNQGAEHDRHNAGGRVAFPHAYCLQNASRTPFFRTIMAYACDGGVDCPRVNHWSNPAVQYEGIPTGIREGEPGAADNHLTLEKTRRVAARWRCSTGS